MKRKRLGILRADVNWSRCIEKRGQPPYNKKGENALAMQTHLVHHPLASLPLSIQYVLFTNVLLGGPSAGIAPLPTGH